MGRLDHKECYYIRRGVEILMNARKYSNIQEKSVAKAVKGRQQSNSGATMFHKGDVCTDDILFECKTCIKDRGSITIEKKWINKNREEAFAMRKDYSIIAFNFLQNGENFYIIDERLFKTLLEKLEEDKKNAKM